MLKIELIVEGLEEELRVDKYIANNYDEVSRSELKYYFDEQKIFVNSSAAFFLDLSKISSKILNPESPYSSKTSLSYSSFGTGLE